MRERDRRRSREEGADPGDAEAGDDHRGRGRKWRKGTSDDAAGGAWGADDWRGPRPRRRADGGGGGGGDGGGCGGDRWSSRGGWREGGDSDAAGWSDRREGRADGRWRDGASEDRWARGWRDGSSDNGWEDGCSSRNGWRKGWRQTGRDEERSAEGPSSDSLAAGADRAAAGGGDAGGSPDGSLAKAKAKLSQLPSGGLAAIVTFQGSFCPVTLGHVMCVVEARELLLGRKHRRKSWAPSDLETFEEVVGFMGCNTDKHVSKKLAPLPAIPLEDRERLIDMAAEEHDWLQSHRQPYDAVDKLRSSFPRLSLKHFVVDGADAALWTKPWRRVKDESRSILVERPAEPGQDNGTDALRRAINKEKPNFSGDRLCILWPEMSGISSSAVRKALLQDSPDLQKLEKLLHPRVLEWALKDGPYGKDPMQAG